MMHFSKDDWLIYANDSIKTDILIDEEKKLKMEEHLINCDSCMETYISVCENLCTEVSSNNPLPVNFTDNIMEQIENFDSTTIKNKKFIIPNMFLYYTAAACLTLFFMRVDVFKNLSNHIFPHTSANTVAAENYLKPSLENTLFKNIKIR